MNVLPSAFGHEGLVAEATESPSAEWLERLCGWVRRAPRDLGPLVWPVLLMPERIDEAFARPADARTVYQEVRWEAALPGGPLELDARPSSVAAAPGGSEVALVSSASSGGVRFAESHVVVRTADPLPPWGAPKTPPVPDAAGAKRRLSFALSEHDVAAFADLTGVHEPIHEDARHAWSLGHPNVLVQELTLLLIMMHVGAAGTAGRAQMWFLAPVPVGSLLTLWQGADRDTGGWEVRAPGTGQIAAVGRLEATSRPDGRCA